MYDITTVPARKIQQKEIFFIFSWWLSLFDQYNGNVQNNMEYQRVFSIVFIKHVLHSKEMYGFHQNH